MNLKDLAYFVALVEEGSFTKAAARMGVSQPTLSTQVKRLEQDLGASLVERSTQKLILTPVGKEVAKRAEDIVLAASDLEHAAAAQADSGASEITLGIFPTLCQYFLAHLLPLLRRERPRLRMRFVECRSPVLKENLIGGEVDAILLAEPFEHRGVTQVPLFREDFLLAVPAGSELEQPGEVHMEDLKETTLTLVNQDHCLRGQTEEVCRAAGALSSQFAATSLETLRYLVAWGEAVTLVPRLAACPPIDQPEGMVLREFADPKPGRDISLFWRTSSGLNPVLEDFAALIRRAFTPSATAPLRTYQMNTITLSNS
ncbi:hydrogen peroxide-inducible genes activator [Mobiluncus mulieris]|uniref:hydrogen peroxide-inducible genes activator n=1 Tax=Mobiluncus mulieris TaxID=2052 RepID=UPI002432047D|nr:hydrogen peroxide-inducible genes activator [Mobiluncus mulieris]